MTVTAHPQGRDGGRPPRAAQRLAGGHDPEGGRLVAAAQELAAVSVELDDDALPDLVRAGGGPERSLWRTSRLVLLGCGSALRLNLPSPWAGPASTGVVREALGAIGALEGAGLRGPVAMGALPYDPEQGGQLKIPRLLVGAGPSGAWATLVQPKATHRSPAAQRAAIERELDQVRSELALPEEVLPDAFQLSANMPHGEWRQLVRRATAYMELGHLDKVVLARRVDVVANRPFVKAEALARLASLYPSCAVFHVDGFIGASPEILVKREGREILSHPLAGTVPRSGDDQTDAALLAALMGSPKDRREHQLVVDAIAAQLGPLCEALEVPAGPSVVALRNVSHLGTLLRGVLRGRGDDAPFPSALELAALLQPTPAVGGHPTGEALRWQRDNEGFDRGRYAGPVGWVDRLGDGEWALGLRSATVSGVHASLYAGAGVVKGSDPEAELAETQLKLQALLAALVRP